LEQRDRLAQVEKRLPQAHEDGTCVMKVKEAKDRKGISNQNNEQSYYEEYPHIPRVSEERG
jgi:hypothetical protein